MDTRPVKVLCINGSPRGAKSRSEKALLQFAKHIAEYGGITELVRLSEQTVLPCQGHYSETRSGSHCTYPCANKKPDCAGAVLEAIVRADALIIATPIYWASATALVHALIERMTCIENNENAIQSRDGKHPLAGKPFILFGSQEADGASFGLTQIAWALNNMGFLLVPYGMLFKPALLERMLVRFGLSFLRETKYRWTDTAMDLSVRTMIELVRRMDGFSVVNGTKIPRC